MFGSKLQAAVVALSAVTWVNGQTFTSCDPTKTTGCPADPGLGKDNPSTTDFTQGETEALKQWTYAAGTTLTYDSTNGAQFVIKSALQAPTIMSNFYIMFGTVEVTLKACAGVGLVSSFILESDDLDEIDWEWLGSTDSSVESNFFGKGNTTLYNRALYHNVATPIETYHTYTIDWQSDKTVWSIDGTPVRTLVYSDPLALGGRGYPQTPMRIKMGNWVGCVDASDPTKTGTCQWAGGQASFDANTAYTMSVTNVKITDQGCGGNYSYMDMSGSFDKIQTNCGSSGSGSSPASSAGSSTATTAVSSSVGTSTSTASTSGGVLVETSTSGSTGSATTLTTASTTGATTKATTTSATSSSSVAQITTSAAESLKPKHKYGAIDVAVMALGLGLGYLVM